MSANNPVQHLSREDWLEKALSVVSSKGGAKLRINNLVAGVGVTKGSFYWHFKHREDFVRSLIDHWHERYTLRVSDYLDDFEGSAQEKLRKLMEMVFVEQLTRHDLAIRSWAVAEPKLQALVKRTDDHRMNYLQMLFRGMGFTEEEAALRSRVFLGYAAWEAGLFETMTKSQREQKAIAFFELITGGRELG
jgi:AcrR family transcriptional regulator